MDYVIPVQKFNRSAKLSNYWLSFLCGNTALLHFGEESFGASEFLNEVNSARIVENPVKLDNIDVIAVLLDFQLRCQSI